MDTTINHNEIYEDELIRLVTSSSDTSSQYVIFRNINDELFALNVAKIEELIQNKDLIISRGVNQNTIMSGVAKIRDHMVTLVDFDKWLNPEVISNEKTHKLIILCGYSNKRIGIIIKSVVGIHSIDAQHMYSGSKNDEKTAYIAELNLGKKVLCNIFDSDKLIIDVFPDIITGNEDKVNNFTHTSATNKLILLAEDSKLIQIPVGKLLTKLNYNYEIYDNGKLMLDRLYELDASDIGLIISDIEMPVMDGIEMLEQIHKNNKYNKIPIIVNTNMANAAVIKHAKELGASEVAKKLDLGSLNELIERYCIR
jgi:two-component system chemotaxis response regulator CheV